MRTRSQPRKPSEVVTMPRPLPRVDPSVIARFSQPLASIVCPEFMELKPFNGCAYDCQWCYLNGTYQFKVDKKGVKLYKTPTFKDPERIELNIKRAFAKHTEPTLYNCGEVADALLYPWILEKNVFPLFKDTKHKLLLLTKNSNVTLLYTSKMQKNVIMAFSVNAQFVSTRWELGAPHPWERLEAARKVSEWGYPVRLRIDPMVPVEDWQTGYRELIDRIMLKVPQVEVITIGSLRMKSHNLNICKELGNDISYMSYLTEKNQRDLRAPEEVRIEMYDFVINELRKKGYKGHIALCKETKSVWDILSKERQPIKKGGAVIPAKLKTPALSICNCRLDTMAPLKTKEKVKQCKLKEE